MFRIDADNYIILYLQYGDELHRYAVPSNWTISILAGHLIDSFDKEKPKHLRRNPNTPFKVLDEAGESIPYIGIVGSFRDGDVLTVKVE